MSGVSAAEDGRGGGSEAVGFEDGGLEGGELLVGDGFGMGVAGDGDVYYGAGGYGRREEDGGKFDLDCS